MLVSCGTLIERLFHAVLAFAPATVCYCREAGVLARLSGTTWSTTSMGHAHTDAASETPDAREPLRGTCHSWSRSGVARQLRHAGPIGYRDQQAYPRTAGCRRIACFGGVDSVILELTFLSTERVRTGASQWER